MSEERYLIEKYHKELQRLTIELNKTRRELDDVKSLNKVLIKFIFKEKENECNINSINNNSSLIKR